MVQATVLVGREEKQFSRQRYSVIVVGLLGIEARVGRSLWMSLVAIELPPPLSKVEVTNILPVKVMTRNYIS